MWTDTFEYKKYPAQMLKVAGDFHRALGAFVNPTQVCFQPVVATESIV